MIVTYEIKDKIVEYIIQHRNGAMFSIDNEQCEPEFGISSSLAFSFFRELANKGLVVNMVISGDSISCCTTSSLDGLYEDGGFAAYASIKSIIESKLMVEAEILNNQLKKGDTTGVMDKAEKIVSIAGNMMSIITGVNL